MLPIEAEGERRALDGFAALETIGGLYLGDESVEIPGTWFMGPHLHSGQQ
jgi:hypothetical protein